MNNTERFDMRYSDRMDTLSGVMENLRGKGLDREFKLQEKGFTLDGQQFYQPEDLTIVQTFRFEGESDPADMQILYILQSTDKQRGYSLDTYGKDTLHEDEEGYDNFIRRIRVANRDEQLTFEV